MSLCVSRLIWYYPTLSILRECLMRPGLIIVSCAILIAFAACNEVPVRNLNNSYSIQMQALRDKGTPAKIDILWVVDDSSSMCQEQQNLASSFKTFLDVFQNYTAIDMRLAVTTTNVCPQGMRGGVRGKFLYQPATTLSPECMERREFPCVAVSEGQTDLCSRMNDVQNPENWVCEPGPTGSAYVCDVPPEVGINDGHEGDVLFAYSSRCRYECDPYNKTTECAEVFGMPEPCAEGGAVCKGNCNFANCMAEDAFEGFSDCPGRCRGRECVEVCAELTGYQADCESRCAASGADCLSVCNSVEKEPMCDAVCDVDAGCGEMCISYLGEAEEATCAQMCNATSVAECMSVCETDTAGGEFLCTVVCEPSYSCQNQCIAQFGDAAYRCQCPGGDCGKVGCVLPPITSFCPGYKGLDKNQKPVWAGPTVLDRQVADYYAIEWIKGNWIAPPGWDQNWKTLPTDSSDESVEARRILTDKVFEHLFTCMATVGTGQDQAVCGNQEQGLRAAWMALDTEGENAEQARNFLREDAYLLIVVVTDEDDCSAPEFFNEQTGKWASYYNSFDGSAADEAQFNKPCSCARDENGCLASGECDYSKCLTNGNFDRHKCQLYSPSSMVNKLRSLKSDPAQVVFASIAGDAIPGSETSPVSDVDLIHERFYECRCGNTSSLASGYNYICASNFGKAEWGKRYSDVADAFGTQYGQFSNICSDEGVGPSLKRIAELVVPLLAQVCLPRPLEWSCQGQCEAIFVDSSSCAEVCAAENCLEQCDQTFQGKPGCAEVCRASEFIEIYQYDRDGNCARPLVDGKCQPLKMITEENPNGDFRLVKNAPACPTFDATMGERPENAIQFKEPLGYTDKLEIVYSAFGDFCFDRCYRFFNQAGDDKFCMDICGDETEVCVDKCLKSDQPRYCSYVCNVSVDDCLSICQANELSDCTSKCELP